MKTNYLKLIIKESILDTLLGIDSKKSKIIPSPFYDSRTDSSLGGLGGGTSSGYGGDYGYGDSGFDHHSQLTHSEQEDLADILDDSDDDGDDGGDY
jgi:hypothetical protein